MSRTLRRFEVLLPLRFNDGTPVPETAVADTLTELEERFGAVSCESQTTRGRWRHEGQSYRDDLTGGRPRRQPVVRYAGRTGFRPMSIRIDTNLEILSAVRVAEPPATSLDRVKAIRCEVTEEISKRRKCKPQTVRDQYGRKLGVTAAVYDSHVLRWLTTNDGKLRSILLKGVADSKYRERIKAFFTRPAGLAAVSVGEGAMSVVVPDSGYVPNMADTRPRVPRDVAVRRGQKEFRDALRGRYNDTCLVTGCRDVAVLEAAHIVPYRGENDNHIDNGLLLRADIHTLFDLDLIGFDPDTLEVRVHPDLSDQYRQFEGGRRLPSGPDRDALGRRFVRFQAALRASAAV